MPHQLDFKIGYQYQSAKGGVSIPTTLTTGQRTVECFAKIDTGSEYCLFQRKLADKLSLDLESGYPLKLETLTGSFLAFGHEITLVTLGIAFEVMVYFATDYGLSRNLLGRNGWLQQVNLGLCDYEEMLYLSPYDEI
jgi:predicted aspartyl protease